MATNRLTLRVGVIFDKKKLKQEAISAQKELDKAFKETTDRQKKAYKDLEKRQTTANKNTKEQTTLIGRLGNAFKKTALQIGKTLILLQALKLATKIIGDAVRLAFELDTAFTNFAIVSKATASELENVDSQVDNLTLSLGKLKKEVIDTVTEFKRAGFTIQESLTLAENAIKGANVGATELSNVTTFLIAGLKAFSLEAEESSRILDVLFKVANTTAINLEGIGEAFLRSANTLQTAGASLEEASALIAGANESIQDPAKVGTALKTIASRLRGVSEDGEAIPKLAESFNAVGISIQEADGSFRNIFDVFKDLAEILPTLDELTRESLLEKLAGKRQKNIVIGLLNNFDTAEQALIDALNSTGEVAQANEKFLDSLQGRTNQLREAWNQLLQTFTDSDALKGAVTAIKNVVVFIDEFIQKTPKAIFLVGGLALAFAPFGTALTVIGGVVSAIAGIGIASDLSKSEIDKLNESISQLDSELGSLDQKINNLEGIKERTDAEERLLDIYREQLEFKKRLRAIESEALAVEQLKEAKELVEDLVSFPVEELAILTPEAFDYVDNLKDIESTLEDQEKQLLKTIGASSELLQTVEEGSKTYETAKQAFDLATEALEKNTQQQISLGFRTESTTSEIKEQVGAITEQVSAFSEVLDLVNTASDDYELLSNALLELETNGYLTDDMLNTLIETYPNLISQTGLAKDAFRDYVDSNKAKTIEEINRLKALAEAEVKSAEARIEALLAVAKANQSAFSLVGAFQEAELAIKNAENNIALLENEKKQIEATESARKKAIESTKKEVEVLSEAETELNRLNFQIELQQKLLERTSIPEKQIEINKELIDLYGQQREALIEQQKELEEQGKALQQGTEEYDDYIEESFKLSLAIEDATNSIVKYTNANKELNKTVAETKLDELEEKLKKLSNSVNDELEKQINAQKKLAKASEEYYDGLISNKKDELDALKKSNEEREKQVELEELLQDLQDLRERRDNILKNDKVQIVKDAEVGFELITDPRKLKQVNEDILNAEKAIEEFKEKQKFEADVERIEATIETLEREAKAEQDSFDLRIDELENFQDEVSISIRDNGKIQEDLTSELAQTLAEIEGKSYSGRLEQLNSFVNQYNTKISQLANQRAEIESIEQSILQTQQNVLNAQATIDSATNPVDSSTVGSTESSSNTSRRINGGGTSTSTSQTSINNLNVNSDADNVEELLRDAERRMHTQF